MVECTVANAVAVLVANSMDGLAEATVTGIHRMAAAPVARRTTRQVAAASSVTVDPSIGQHEQEKVDLQLSAGVRARSGDMLPVALLQQKDFNITIISNILIRCTLKYIRGRQL